VPPDPLREASSPGKPAPSPYGKSPPHRGLQDVGGGGGRFMLQTGRGRDLVRFAEEPTTTAKLDGENVMKRYLGGIVLALWCCSSVHAALLSRLGGQAVYDTDRNITWLANANLAASNTFGVTSIVNGMMNWDQANEWVAAMNTANYLGVNDWRLPTTLQPDPSCGYQSGGVSYGYSCTGSEMGHLFYGELGGVALQSIVTTHNANYSLFSNVQPYYYWSGTVYAPAPGSGAWNFYFGNGRQDGYYQSVALHAWAVRPGDIVPVPAAVWLFGSAMGVFAMVRRRVLAGAGA